MASSDRTVIRLLGPGAMLSELDRKRNQFGLVLVLVRPRSSFASSSSSGFGLVLVRLVRRSGCVVQLSFRILDVSFCSRSVSGLVPDPSFGPRSRSALVHLNLVQRQFSFSSCSDEYRRLSLYTECSFTIYACVAAIVCYEFQAGVMMFWLHVGN